MIVNISQGATFRPAIEYGAGIKKKEKCSELVEAHNLLSTDPTGIADEMTCVGNYSKRVKKPVLHMSVNFHPDENPDRELMLRATHAYLREMSIPIDRHQIVIYEHHDTPHKHFHLFINRVDADTSKAYDDSFIHVRNEAACRKVEKELGLRPTDSIMKVRSERKSDRIGREAKGLNDGSEVSSSWVIKEKDEHRFKVRQFVHTAVERALAMGISNRDDLTAILRQNQIEAVWKDDSQGSFVGASFRYDSLSVTGNAVGFTATDLRKHFSGENVITDTSLAASKPGVLIKLTKEQATEIGKLTFQCWGDVRRQKKIHFESQAVEDFPFTDLLRMVAKKSNLNEAQVYAYVAQFELMKKADLPDIKKKEAAAFARTSKSFLDLAGSVTGNRDSRELFIASMNVERRGNLLFVKEPGHLRYSASDGELATLSNSPYNGTVYIPKVFSFAERSILLNIASEKEIKQSFYDIDPSRLKAIFEPDMYRKIESQLNQNYVKTVLAGSPARFEEKLEFLRQRGIVIEPDIRGSYSLGFIGNVSTGEITLRVPASESFTKMLKSAGYGQEDYEATRASLLSPRGQFTVALAQALDRGDVKQSNYIMTQVYRLNKGLAGYTDPRELLEALSGRSGKMSGQGSKLEQEARKIRWKIRRR